MQTTRAALRQDALWIVGGPLLVGACLANTIEPARLTHFMISLPMVFIGVGLLMMPALYITGAFLGIAPEAAQTLAAARATLRDIGKLLCGLVPALAFLVATATQPGTVLLLGHAVVGLGAMLGLTGLFRRLFTGGKPRLSIPIFYFAWSLIVLGIGWRLFLATFTP